MPRGGQYSLSIISLSLKLVLDRHGAHQVVVRRLTLIDEVVAAGELILDFRTDQFLNQHRCVPEATTKLCGDGFDPAEKNLAQILWLKTPKLGRSAKRQLDFDAAETSDVATPRSVTFRIIIVKEEVRMLVLSRKAGEQIVIQLGDQIVVVRIVGIARDRVRLGIIAPPEVPVHREELVHRIEACEGNRAIANEHRGHVHI